MALDLVQKMQDKVCDICNVIMHIQCCYNTNAS